MMALSLWQPHASLIFLPDYVGGGFCKPFETRGWPPPSRLFGQRIAIHAAKNTSYLMILDDYLMYGRPSIKDEALEKFVLTLDAQRYGWKLNLPLGCLIGTVRLVDCHSTNSWKPHGPAAWFGDFTPDRFAWEFDDPRLLPQPLPYRGRQRLFQAPY